MSGHDIIKRSIVPLNIADLLYSYDCDRWDLCRRDFNIYLKRFYWQWSSETNTFETYGFDKALTRAEVTAVLMLLIPENVDWLGAGKSHMPRTETLEK